MTDKIFILGGTGSLGRHLPRQNGLFFSNLRLEDSEEQFILALKKDDIDIVINFAAMTDPAQCENDPKLAFAVNSEAVEKLFKSATVAGCKKFIQISTSHVYGTSSKEKKFKVNDTCLPNTVYGKSKYQAEKRLIALAEKHKINLSIIRVFSIISSKMRDGFLYRNLINRAKNKDYSAINGLNSVRDFIHARDAMAMVMRVAKTDNNPIILNACSGTGTSIRELTKRVYLQYGADPYKIENFSDETPFGDYLVGEPSKTILDLISKQARPFIMFHNIYNFGSLLLHRVTLGLFPKSLIGFGLIGLMGYCTHFSVLFLTNYFIDDFYICHFLASFFALTQNYIFNFSLNFKLTYLSLSSFIGKYFRFVLITFPGIIITAVMIVYFSEGLDLAISLMSLIASLVDFLLRYTLSRIWVFKK